jgi:cytochrome c biogenesis protein CcdA
MLDSVLYLSGFATGTILAMVVFAFLMGLVSQKAADFPKSKLFRNIRIASGVIAIAIGILWLVA